VGTRRQTDSRETRECSEKLLPSCFLILLFSPPRPRGELTGIQRASRVRFGPIGAGVYFHSQATAELGGLSHFFFN
jgi:hypothetical protein